MTKTPSGEPLHEAVMRAFEVSGVWERVLARLPGFQVPLSFRFRHMGERILGRWGVEPSAQLMISARWRQAAFVLVVLSAGLVVSSVLSLQLVGAALDVIALGCAVQASHRRTAAGIPVAGRSKMGRGHVRV
ncbi:MAG: hypothetical protein ACP5QO_01350 [Clostridia bacterium]